VYTRTDGVWSQQGSKLVGSGATGNAEQGYGVALSGDGNTAMIGGRHDNTNLGAAWVFTRTNGVWSQQDSKLVGSGAIAYAEQGSSVALSSDASTALSGGDADNRGRGATWVFVPGQAPAQPSNKFTISQIRTFVDGTVRFQVTVPGPGTIDVLETAWKNNLASVAVLLAPAQGRFVFTRAPHSDACRNAPLDRNPQRSRQVARHSSHLSSHVAAMGHLHPDRREVPQRRFLRSSPARGVR